MESTPYPSKGPTSAPSLDEPVSSRVARPFDLTGRTAVVTGGNGGIGFGIARALAQAGANIAVWARDQTKTQAAVSELQRSGTRAAGFRCDVSSEPDVVAAAQETAAEFGSLDMMIANAGALPERAPVVDLETNAWEQSLRLNLTGTFLCFREAARIMIAGDVGGALVAISSEAATEAAPTIAPYAVAKAGIGGLVRTLAVELAPHRIRCNVLVPGWTENHSMSADTVDQELRRETIASIPAGRWGTPDDLGVAAVYLADPSLAYHTGSELVVDGGYAHLPSYRAVRTALGQPPGA